MAFTSVRQKPCLRVRYKSLKHQAPRETVSKGHFPLTLPRPQLVTRSRFEGQPTQYMVPTGAFWRHREIRAMPIDRWARTAPGRNPECPCGPQRGSGPDGQLGGKPLGRPAGRRCAGLRGATVEIERRLNGSHWLRYRGRYLHLRRCPEPLRQSASPSGLRPPGRGPGTGAPKPKSNTNTMCRLSTLEKTMEADISILRKTGHFYFALTPGPTAFQPGTGHPRSRSPATSRSNLADTTSRSITALWPKPFWVDSITNTDARSMRLDSLKAQCS